MQNEIFTYLVVNDLTIISPDNIDEMAEDLFLEFKDKTNDLEQLRQDIQAVLNELNFDYNK